MNGNIIQRGSAYGEDNKVLEDARPYSSYKSVIKKNHPLMIMVRSEREDLLAILNHQSTETQVAYSGTLLLLPNLIVYLVYLIFISGFALTVPSPITVVTDDLT
ncbi:hypothetical protein EB796_005786 [Bugula neritina]|uniref:Uncharacterized protein n=1 Tax=Bugula neritina TaxID=10212 RepID=A0A7J7KB86_BUGNE|nr:hypothetical protein EB796_005786 [Bugula neritina]